jgi:hypothetical protein
MANSWNEAKAAAMKVLGNKGKIPETKVNTAKWSADATKANSEYDAAVEVLQAKILALQNMYAIQKNIIKQHSDLIAKNNLGLDPKDEDDKDKIEQGQKILGDYLDEVMENCDVNIKNLDELDKHSMAISKYESKTTC